MDKYILERDGQLDFYKVFLPRVNPALDIDEILADNNDGVINGNLLEFKLHVTDLNAVLFQCIKYLSALRVKGKPVPANILIIDVNAATLWLYRSAPYLSDIEKLFRQCDNENRLPVPERKESWHFTKEARSIGPVSQRRTEQELDALLARQTARRRKSSLTS